MKGYLLKLPYNGGYFALGDMDAPITPNSYLAMFGIICREPYLINDVNFSISLI